MPIHELPTPHFVCYGHQLWYVNPQVFASLLEAVWCHRLSWRHFFCVRIWLEVLLCLKPEEERWKVRICCKPPTQPFWWVTFDQRGGKEPTLPCSAPWPCERATQGDLWDDFPALPGEA